MPGPNRPARSGRKLEPSIARALDVPVSARERQVAEAVLMLVGDRFDDDDDRIPNVATLWLRHLVDLIDEHDWQHGDRRQIAAKVANDSISDIFIDDVPVALKVVAPADRATGPAAVEAMHRRLTPFCERLLDALGAADVARMPPPDLP